MKMAKRHCKLQIVNLALKISKDFFKIATFHFEFYIFQ